MFQTYQKQEAYKRIRAESAGSLGLNGAIKEDKDITERWNNFFAGVLITGEIPSPAYRFIIRFLQRLRCQKKGGP